MNTRDLYFVSRVKIARKYVYAVYTSDDGSYTALISKDVVLSREDEIVIT